MALDVLLLATRDHLRETCALKPEECEVTADGRPLPAASNFFVAVHEGDWAPNPQAGAETLALHETFGVQLTATLWCSYSPVDRLGAEVLAKASSGLLARLRPLLVAVHMSYTLMDRANKALGTNRVNGFWHPLAFSSPAGPTTLRGPDWFHAKGNRTNPPSGLSRTLSFRNAQRSQTLESME